PCSFITASTACACAGGAPRESPAPLSLAPDRRRHRTGAHRFDHAVLLLRPDLRAAGRRRRGLSLGRGSDLRRAQYSRASLRTVAGGGFDRNAARAGAIGCAL